MHALYISFEYWSQRFTTLCVQKHSDSELPVMIGMTAWSEQGSNFQQNFDEISLILVIPKVRPKEKSKISEVVKRKFKNFGDGHNPFWVFYCLFMLYILLLYKGVVINHANIFYISKFCKKKHTAYLSL